MTKDLQLLTWQHGNVSIQLHASIWHEETQKGRRCGALEYLRGRRSVNDGITVSVVIMFREKRVGNKHAVKFTYLSTVYFDGGSDHVLHNQARSGLSRQTGVYVSVIRIPKKEIVSRKDR